MAMLALRLTLLLAVMAVTNCDAQDARGEVAGGACPDMVKPDGPRAQTAADGARRWKTPDNILWVDASARSDGLGSAAQPFRTISAAVRNARPCTAIMVRAGTYSENVVFARGQDGRPDCPIRLTSADGAGKARIIATENDRSAIEGGGNENIAVEGFEIVGGRNGVHFGQNGGDWSDLARGIVIRFNTISRPLMDGIKINGAEDVLIAHNEIASTGQEGIDFVGVVRGIVDRNTIAGIGATSAAIFAKGGSHAILVSGNRISDVGANGISVGGWTNPQFNYRAGYDEGEATCMLVTRNIVERVGKSPLIFLGAKRSVALGNLLAGSAEHPVAIVAENNPKAVHRIYSSEVEISNNILRGGRPLKIRPGNETVIFEKNREGGLLEGSTGADLTLFTPRGSGR
ncbi:right-handed parallel beta-helix repeat-containing protein [Sphingomonas sp. LY54]|uniref:right-handed parallel beta-helix repeat-containing protein n=1 Tax=Sphingomonas sp. LY54 TaxID=3095343 RepID=UPI002D797BC9|nr:right-handed parallel beta-helix repeat-containing protein [Sphingomonas sp. LY54]WRP28194.1 right-handed parallel beta-helix repeat-containing protein [Sphingomonas sp. LY54]